jgi:hypothetical protein
VLFIRKKVFFKETKKTLNTNDNNFAIKKISVYAYIIEGSLQGVYFKVN